MQPAHPYTVLIAVAALVGCTEQSVPIFENPVPISVPSGDPAYGPQFSAGVDGAVILSWMERDEVGASLRFSRYEQASWGPPVTVTQDEKMNVSWASLPGVTATGPNSLLAHWYSNTGDTPYAYQILTADSGDDGGSWSVPVSPHRDGTPTEHGFVSLYPNDGGTGLVWLDGRNTPDKGMTLRSATRAAGGGLSDETVIDDWVCDCCQTDVALSEAGPIVIYRNRTPDEVRDIYVARQLDGQWQPGTPVSNDGWVMSGCPVNGPAIDAAGEEVVVAWFTAANQKPKIQTAVSTNSGESFSEAVEISSDGALGHVGVALIDSQSYVVSWMEEDKNGDYAIKLRGVTRDGQVGPVRVVGRTSVARNVPQLLRIGNKLLLAWTDEIDKLSKVVSVEVAIRGFYD